MLRTPADPIEKFVKKRTFACPMLGNARITPEQCVGRQLREVETRYFGRKITVNNSPFDKWCRSGCCELGLVQLKKLEPAAYAERVAERREAKAPCKPLGEHTCAI